jgi:hypothetical protein
MLNKFGFFQNPRTKGGPLNSTTDFVRSVNVNAVKVNVNTARFDVTSNLPNTTLKFALNGVSNTDFSSGNISHNFTTDSSGDYSTTLVVDSENNFNLSNVDFFANVTFGTDDFFLASSSNLTIVPSYPITALGGNITTTGNLWTTHVFDTNSSFNVSSIDSDWASTKKVYAQIVGGGGGGGFGATYQEVIFGAFQLYNTKAGGGGGGGQVTQSNANISDYSVTNYTVVVGSGGAGGQYNGAATAGQTSSLHTATAQGGGEGASFDHDCTDGFPNGGGGSAPAPLRTRTSVFAGATGTSFNGGNATMSADQGDTRFMTGGGGGAGADGVGGAAFPQGSGFAMTGGSAGSGLTTWSTYPGYDTHIVGKGGKGGAATSVIVDGADGTLVGEGGTGANQGIESSFGFGTFFADGGTGANGQVRIAYQSKLRKLA